MAGVYIGVIAAFLPVVVRRMGGSTTDVALVAVTMWVISIANMASYATLMQGIYPDSERASAMGKVRVGVSIASIASATLAGLFIDQVSATIVFAVAAAIAIPGGIAFGRIRHDPPAIPPVRRRPSQIAVHVCPDRRYRRLFLALTVFGFGNLMNAAIYPILLVDHFNAPNSSADNITPLHWAPPITPTNA